MNNTSTPKPHAQKPHPTATTQPQLRQRDRCASKRKHLNMHANIRRQTQRKEHATQADNTPPRQTTNTHNPPHLHPITTTHQQDPPPTEPTAQHRPIRRIPNENQRHTDHTITTDTAAFNLPHDWWEHLLDHERHYDTDILETYRSFQDTGNTLCV